MRIRLCAVLLLGFSIASGALGQTPAALRQQAVTQFQEAERAETSLIEKPQAERSRSDYLKVIGAYERVYLITPHSGYADNALISISRLYEEIQDKKNAIKTLQFLIKEYPQTQFRDVAERDIARMLGTVDADAKDAAVDNIRYFEAGSTARVVVDITGEIKFKIGDVQSPNRVFIDVSPARLNSMLKGKEWPVSSKLFQKIRVAQYSDLTVRIVLDGALPKRVNVFTLKDPSRLIIDVSATEITGSPVQPPVNLPAPAPAPQPPAAPAAPPAANSVTQGTRPPAPQAPATGVASQPAPNPNKPPAGVESAPPAAPAPPASANLAMVAANNADTPPVAVVTPAKPTSLGERSLIQSLGLKLSRVVIDPGHGGHDTGSIGPTGYTEKELVLDVAKRLRTLIEEELGLETVLTRSDDGFVPLETRTDIANREKADLFISIHANSSRVRSVTGVETYFLNLNTQSKEALEIATRENASSNLSVSELGDVLKKLMQNDKVDESRELAHHIQTSMSKRKESPPNRGVKQAPFVVLMGATMPSILAEITFISNAAEERQLKRPEYRQGLAESLLAGVRSYAETLSGIKTARSQETK
jgi:N-acetylmuramoyl-L-alanine amidase